MSKTRVVVLGAGFGGLELSTLLSEALGDAADVVLVDRGDAFVFGFSKLDFMFGRTTPEAVRLPYRSFAKPGVRLLRQTVTAIDPGARRVTTDAGSLEADFLVIALGADYDYAATPGLAETGDEFYSVEGAKRLRDKLPGFVRGHAVIGVCHAPYKCPPAPSEASLMLHDYLTERGVRGDCTITFVVPLPSPIPPSPSTSAALLQAFAERDIRFIPGKKVARVDGAAHTISLDDGTTLPCDLLLGVPKNRAPDVVIASGITQDGWVTVNPRTLETQLDGVYAIGDLANTGTPKAGVFAERHAKAVATSILSRLRGGSETGRYDGTGVCYVELGHGEVGRIDVDFFSGPAPTGTFTAPTPELAAEKAAFGATRRARWFGV